jgi:hypothetical protein
MKTETKNINLRIDKNLLENIKSNAKEIGNSTTKEINEMLWLALKPRSEQIKKVLAIRSSTLNQINGKSEPSENQEDCTDEEYSKFIASL